MEIVTTATCNSALTPLSPMQQRLLNYFNEMNERAQDYLLNFMEDVAALHPAFRAEQVHAQSERGAS